VTRYLILGAGRFGRLACERLHDRDPAAEIFLVDHAPEKFYVIGTNPALRTVTAAAALYLANSLNSESPPDWIIPAIPRHVAFDWLWQQRPSGHIWRQIPTPAAVGKDLPFVQRGTSEEICLSLSTKRCPDNCPEPDDSCYLTGKPRKYCLYDYLANISLQDYISLVIRSRQLAPGVGGFRPEDLRLLRHQVLNSTGKILISTACCCHGVSHALEKLI
jgi:hypothetical protein